MSDPPRRPILKLKFPPPAPRPEPEPEAAPEQASGTRWKCKPCGGVVIITGQEAAGDEVRCPACNARLGLAGDFQEGGGTVRARRLPPPRTAG